MSFSKKEAKTKVFTKKQFHQISLKVKRPFVESLNQVGRSSQVVQDTALKEKRPKTKRFKVRSPGLGNLLERVATPEQRRCVQW